MSSVRFLLMGAICLLLVTHSESWFFKIQNILKPLCKITFGIVCPVGLAAGAAAITVGSAGAATGAAAGGAALGGMACTVAMDKCKRNLDGEMVMLPFSDNFDDFDKDGDGLITFKELLEAVMSTVNLSDPEDLFEPFSKSDTTGDKKLDRTEFAKSEFLFPGKPNKNSGVHLQKKVATVFFPTMNAMDPCDKTDSSDFLNSTTIISSSSDRTTALTSEDAAKTNIWYK